MDGFTDLYALLGVAPQAEPDVIRAAYRALARRYHPDRTGAVTHDSRMAHINQAYEVLSCPVRRRAYDQWRHRSGQRQHVALEQSPDAWHTSGTSTARPSVLTTYDRHGRLHAFI